MEKVIGSVLDKELFDETPGYDEEAGLRIAAGLSPDERKQAITLYRLFNELWGLCVVFGKPGTGKDTFGNVISYLLKKYFPWKRILRDEKPRKLYGSYAGLFNEQVIKDDLDIMREVAKNGNKKEYDDLLEKAADNWVTERGEALLKNSVLYLTEFWRYCYNREPHNPMNKTMGGIHKMKRHIDTLILGTAQLEGDLDKKTCKPFIDWRVDCARIKTNPTGFAYYISKVTYSSYRDSLDVIGKPFVIPIDAGKPRTDLSDGKIIIKKLNYKPETEEEDIVLYVLKSGIDTYEKIVEIIEEEGDMTEDEILFTLKDLGLKLPNRRPKFVISYPCWFKIYNSKSAPQMRTNVKVAM